METIYTNITKNDYFIYSDKNKNDLLIQTADKQMALNMAKIRKQTIKQNVFIYHKNKLIKVV